MEKEIKELLQQVKRTEVKTDPFMAKRVMAHVETKRRERKLFFWQFATFSSLLACAFVLYFNIQNVGQPDFGAEVDKPQLVKVEVAPFDFQTVVEAEIILPDGVEFYSKDFVELAEQRSLRVSIDPANMNALPFIIKGKAKGNKSIKVNFFNPSNELVKTKDLNIKFFKGLGEQS